MHKTAQEPVKSGSFYYRLTAKGRMSMGEHYKCIKEDIIENLIKRVDSMDSLRDAITKISTLMEVQISLNQKTEERFEKYDKIMQKQSETLVLISDTMSRQNQSIEKLNEKMDETRNDLNKRIDELNKRVHNTKIEEKKDKAEIAKAKFAFYGVIVTGILSCIGILLPLIIK